MEIIREKIIELLYESIAELNELRGKDEQLEKSPKTSLLGDGASLDSLGFVNFVAMVEEKCQDRFSKNLVLTDATEKPGVRDPFATVATLAEYIELGLTDRLASWR